MNGLESTIIGILIINTRKLNVLSYYTILQNIHLNSENNRKCKEFNKRAHFQHQSYITGKTINFKYLSLCVYLIANDKILLI